MKYVKSMLQEGMEKKLNMGHDFEASQKMVQMIHSVNTKKNNQEGKSVG